MKHKIHTREWLIDTRKRAGLTTAELAALTGIHINSLSFYETGKRNATPSSWSKIDQALYPRVPAAFVNEDALIEDARAYERLAYREGMEKTCRLYYATGRDGVAFIEVGPDRDGNQSAPYVILSWDDAVKLLEAQKSVF